MRILEKKIDSELWAIVHIIPGNKDNDRLVEKHRTNIMQILDQYVAEIIGEDDRLLFEDDPAYQNDLEKGDKTALMAASMIEARNMLRRHQKKRAGL